MFGFSALAAKFLPKFPTVVLLRLNHYKSLGLTAKATQSEIKSAYYRLSKIYHPDKNHGSEESAKKFRDITAAYEILGKEESRRMYDLEIRKPDMDFGFKTHFDQRPFKRHETSKPYKKVWKCKTSSRLKKKRKKYKRKFGKAAKNFGPFSFDDVPFSYSVLFFFVVRHL